VSDITPLTVFLEFLPTIVVFVVYFIFFHDRRNHFIEAFILLMLIKAVTYFIYNIAMANPDVVIGFDDTIDFSVLYWVIITDFVFHFAYALQEFFTWIMVAFVAVLFGQVVLAVKLALQDPLKLRFANLINKQSGQRPVSDGYSGLRDRMSQITFSNVESQPLDPEVVSRAWSESWKDYLIIGLATLLPSVGIYMMSYNLDMSLNTNVSSYAVGVWIFLTWIYRFGYPASNRIAKGLGIKLGDKDLGSEMMHGVLGWFFRLNILLTLVLIGQELFQRMQAGLLGSLGQYYLIGIVQAAPPILFALILLPMTEGFAQVLYKKSFEAISSPRLKLSAINWKNTMFNLLSAIGTGTLATGAFVGAVMGISLNFAFNFMSHNLFIYPNQVDGTVLMMIVNGLDNAAFIPPTIWTLMMLIVPLSMMLLLGVLGHYVRRRVKGGLESFAFFAGFFVSVAVWLILPGMDYLLAAAVTPASIGGLLFFRMRPIVMIPQASDFLMRIAYEFVVAVPMFIAAALFILYYFEFGEQWKKHTGEVTGPLLTVHARDIWDVAAMFSFGIIGAVLGVFILSYFIDPFAINSLVLYVVIEIGNPNGLEMAFAQSVSPFVLYAEHNVVRTLLMLVAGPVFWTLVLWLVAVKGKEKSARNMSWASLIAAIGAACLAVVWTFSDAANGIFDPVNPPWSFAAELGLRAFDIFFLLFAATAVIWLFNRVARGNDHGWWFPPLLMLFGIEYFVYDDQFTLIALIVLPMIIAALYKAVFYGRPQVRSEALVITYIRFSLMSLAIAEVLSTALWVAGIGAATSLLGMNVVFYLASILPHGVIEIPAFLFAAAASIRIARDLAPSIQAQDWASVPSKTKLLLGDTRLWRTYVLVLFFLLIAALVEGYITPIVALLFLA